MKIKDDIGLLKVAGSTAYHMSVEKYRWINLLRLDVKNISDIYVYIDWTNQRWWNVA
jgi:hypothetical protein